MLLPTVALYAGLLALTGQFLASVVGTTRGRLKIPLGDGGKPELIVANRRHMNFVENVPILITLLAVIELNGAPKLWIHVMGVALVAAASSTRSASTWTTCRAPRAFSAQR